ncbi:MAG: ABC transporter permease [Candidatus Dactylopiibacterium carminicum]|uniref:ABC transporter permease n=1 Tax=Candidatus Dactylopiibacterium carminicum TaxID=857335 RepID=A0A272EVX1_9RHOO|nr:amino acid ABC transporter permease [Candidatus Dactylopiibacterium carminicum]KAF7599612.1 amino acid ABC transporter permease [Candidatus Dactylopiibacterium carminicum]PAS94259.1 MAG: ABC transporter permease [Candidatus Dactylopiibacterium carminicum]PAS99615.1 MAG: ABC transporter permease [Candidatus Dactylopiibacterium carminicum]
MDFQLSFLLSADVLPLLFKGMATTVRLFACAWVLGMLVALLLVGLRAVPWRWLDWLVAVFVEYHRNVPTVVQIMVWYFGMPEILPRDIKLWINRGDTEFLFAMIALALNASAFFAEDIRSGMRTVPHTQLEAARSIGLSAFGALWHVILPQALRISVPPLINRALILFKDTSLAMAIGVVEMTYQTKAIENLTFRSMEVFVAATLFYLVASLVLMALGAWFNQRFPPAHKG